MLTMEQIYHIRYLKKFKGKSLRKISEETGTSFTTVKKYINKDDFNIQNRPKQQRKGKLDKYKETVKNWLIEDLKAPYKQRHTAKRVYDRLIEEFDDFDASDRSVRSLVAQLKSELKIQEDGYLPLEHMPGEAQADFGEVRFVENSIEYDGYYLNISFPYSNAGFTQVFKSCNQECLFEGMKNIFSYIGGVPTTIWFDNMSTAVKKVKKYGERDLTDGFLRFMTHYGFRSNFCNPNSGNEKGNIENKVGYHRRNLFVPIPEFTDLKEYNKKLLLDCTDDMNRKHYRKNKLIRDLFTEDADEFFTLPKVEYEVCKYEYAKADNYGKVRYENKIYSGSPKIAGKQAMIKIGAYEIDILDLDGKLIIKHNRIYTEQKESMNWLPYLELMSKRPRALKYSGFYNDLPDMIRDYLDECEYEKKKESLRYLHRMTEQNGIETAIRAFEESIRIGVKDLDSIWTTYIRLTSANLPEDKIKLPPSVPQIKGYDANLKVYDSFLSSGGVR